MRINIINLDKDKWILTKFAQNLYQNLKNQGHTVFLSKKSKEDVDVNHFIIFLFQKENQEFYFKNTINTNINQIFFVKLLTDTEIFIKINIKRRNRTDLRGAL